MKKIILSKTVLFILLLTSCNQEKKTQTQTKEKVEISPDSKKIPSNIDGDFSLFLERFSKDSVFQVSRVKFPLKTSVWEDPEVGMVEKLINKTEYTTLDLTYPDDAMTREFDKYTQKINLQGNKCVIEIRGYDNGIYSDLFFEKINGKWTLISCEDHST